MVVKLFTIMTFLSFKSVFVLLVSVWNISSADILNNERCGLRASRAGPESRIFGGREVPSCTAWPWMGRHGTCGAILISERWAVSSPFCASTTGNPTANFTIIFGDTARINGTSPYRQEAKVKQTYIQPDYVRQERNIMALLYLDPPVEFNDCVQPICLNQLSNEWDVYDNCWIVGWGDRRIYEGRLDNDRPRILQEAAAIKVLSTDECQSIYTQAGFPQPFNESLICASPGLNRGPRECHGDSGSPLMCSLDGERWYLTGQAVLSFGGCGANTIVYHRISENTDFIDATVRRAEECTDPDYRCSSGNVCAFDGECDGVVQCPDADDEMFCPETSATPPSFCSNTTCMNGGSCIEENGGFLCECPEPWAGQICGNYMCPNETISLSVDIPVNITSPLYPDDYPHSADCKWTVIAPTGYKIRVDFLDFNVEAAYDLLYLDNTTFAEVNQTFWSGFLSTDESLDIAFTSDRFTQDKGFLLQLSAVDTKGVNECLMTPSCQNNGTCIDEDDGFKCQCTEEWVGQYCTELLEGIDVCRNTSITLDDNSPVNLQSFNYPGINRFQPEHKCVWQIYAPNGRQIRVKFLDLQIWTTNGISRDIFSLNSRVYLGVPSEDYVTDGDELEIVYASHGIAAVSLGFDVIISAEIPPDGDECSSGPCQNSGRCYDRVNGFTCKCKRGFSGNTCQTGLSRCGRNSFQCANGRCVKASDVCDGRNNCADYSDEINCECEFNCYNGKCLPQRFVCDKNNNCGDWTDEYRPEC